VVAEGGWDHASGFEFRMQFVLVCERATYEYDSQRSPALRVARGGRSAAVPLAPGTGYEGEVRHFLAVCRGRERLAARVDEAVGLIEMLAAERASLRAGRRICVPR
jgi:predicted dehydrogenase